MAGERRYLVTGAFGCIGAWTVARLVAERTSVVAFDAAGDPRRLRLLLDEDDLGRVTIVRGDITDLDGLQRVLDEHDVTHVIHLAALQVPFCRADPSLGARVNVVGTVNVLEAVRRRAERMGPVVYASSIAAYDAVDAGTDPAAMSSTPSTLYGVYKRANEGTAQVYAADWGVASIGLRPHTVYGPGRDQGLTSAPTAALLAAAAGTRYRVPFGGRLLLQYAPDVAQAFVESSRADAEGATVHDLGGVLVDMREFLAALEAEAPGTAGRITAADEPLPFPADFDASSWEALVGRPCPVTPLRRGVADSLARFRSLLERGVIAVERG
jgi:UDP-glucuronate 4-epimerase